MCGWPGLRTAWVNITCQFQLHLKIMCSMIMLLALIQRTSELHEVQSCTDILCKSCFAEHSFHWILKLFTVCFLSELLFCFSLSSSASLSGPPMWLMTITKKFSNNNAQDSQTIGLCIVLLQWCHNDVITITYETIYHIWFTGNQTNNLLMRWQWSTTGALKMAKNKISTCVPST